MSLQRTRPMSSVYRMNSVYNARGLNGFWDWAQGQVEDFVQGSQTKDIHIPEQQKAIEEISAILSSYRGLRDSGQLTEGSVNSTISAIDSVALRFDSFARALNTERALKGATEVNNFAYSAIEEVQQGRQIIRSSFVPTDAMSSLSGLLPLLLGVGAILAISKAKVF